MPVSVMIYTHASIDMCKRTRRHDKKVTATILKNKVRNSAKISYKRWLFQEPQKRKVKQVIIKG